MKQFPQSSDAMVTRRQLEAPKHKNSETFTDYITRWQAKIQEMIDRRSEEDQIIMILKNVTNEYKWPLSLVPHKLMSDLIQAGTQIEDAIKEGVRVLPPTQSESKPRKARKE